MSIVGAGWRGGRAVYGPSGRDLGCTGVLDFGPGVRRGHTGSRCWMRGAGGSSSPIAFGTLRTSALERFIENLVQVLSVVQPRGTGRGFLAAVGLAALASSRGTITAESRWVGLASVVLDDYAE